MVNQARTSAPDHSDVLVFPPIIPLTGFLGGLLLERVWPIGARVGTAWRADLRVLGFLAFCAGAAGFAWMVVTMKRAQTPIHNAKAPTTLVESGPFRFTRNPMYLFGSTAYLGLALLTMKLWPLVLLPLVLLVTHHGVVLPEEAYLDRKFGPAYDDYRRRVRRWL